MKKQIDFNHELIGKEGITVERRDGVGIDFVKVYPDNTKPILVVRDSGISYYLNKNGIYDSDLPTGADLLMFQEITEMSGEEYADKMLGFHNSTYSFTQRRLKEIYAENFDAGKQHIKELHNIK